MKKNSRLVYSTDVGRIKQTDTQTISTETDDIVRVRRESKGRGGKVVCVVEGLPPEQLKDIGKALKSACATGGATKNGCVEIQGDHREKIRSLLEDRGFQVKLAGG